MNVTQLGEFIRNQRRSAQMSVRKLAKLAGVSNPYLSQIERGLRRPSAEMLQAIAKGLRISAQTLYVQAGILDAKPEPDVHAAVMGDPGLTERQKQALLSVYDSFRQETARRRAARKAVAPPEDRPVFLESPGPVEAPSAESHPANGRIKPTTNVRQPSRARRSQASGRAETQADSKPSPGSPSSSRSQSTDRPTKGGAP